MTQPSADLTQLDGSLGILPPSVGFTQAIIGPSTTGPTGVVAAFGRAKDIRANYGEGPLVENACYQIAKTGKPVVVVRSGTTTAGDYGVVSVTGVQGNSAISTDATGAPYDEYEAYVQVKHGGVIGGTGANAITFQWSLDQGRTLSGVTKLGTANHFTTTDGNVRLDFGSGTLVAGDYFFVRTTPPKEDQDDFNAAMAALGSSKMHWDFANFATPMSAAQVAAVDTWLAALWTAGKHKAAMVNARGPNFLESEADYYTALETEYASTTSLYMSVSAGYAKTQSAVSGRQYRRPVSWVAAARATAPVIRDAAVSLAQVSLGPLPADVSIRDSNGNPDEHDETENPGLDDLGFLTLRTFSLRKGVYINLPRIMAPTGSDFIYWHYRMVMNKAADALLPYLEERLQAPIRVDKETGFILEADALDIESGANAVLSNALLTFPSASDAIFVIDRNYNILSTQTMPGDARIVPLAYPVKIPVTIGFDNPAARIITV